MRIAVLGPLEVRTGAGDPVKVPGAKERLLLAVLSAVAPHPVSSDALAEALWDGVPPASARKSLQIHLVRLRNALEPDRPHGSTGRYVVRNGPGYSLAVERQDVDALLMADLTARGAAVLVSGHYAEAEAHLSGALALWRGTPFADWPDAAFAVPERRRLSQVRTGALRGLLEARLQMGRPAEVLPELERLVTEDPLDEEWWRLLVLSLYRAGRQSDALAAARRIRRLLAEELGVEPGPALRRTEAAVLAQDPALDALPAQRETTTRTADMGPGGCPYKGLAVYEASDAPLFHGRRRVVSALVARLVDAPMVVVSGPSGAGKSSVVRAGLLPALADGALPGSPTWQPVVLKPGSRPVDSLAALTGEDPPTVPVLLVCDQFEELWGSEVDRREREAFLAALLGLLDDGVVVRCLLVVRGDHVGRLAEDPVLADLVSRGLVLVPPLSEEELRDVVREPAHAVGLGVEPELLDAVVADGLGRHGALPLLSTALVGTWERRAGDLLTLAGYLASGGVAGAVTRSAETAYGGLDADGRRTARAILVRLADVDDTGVLARRRASLAELDLDGEDEGTQRRRAVVEAFVRRRLLTVDGSRLEVAHEALLTAWPRLVAWLEEDAEGRRVRRHLAPAAREWIAAGRPDDELFRGARLAAALDWAAGLDADLTPVERSFLEASRARSDRELRAARERADREAAGRRRTRRLAGALTTMLVVALAAGAFAVRSRADSAARATEAERASRVADANWLSTRIGTARSLPLALLLAAQAARLADTPDTRDGLLALVSQHRRVVRAVPLPGRAERGLLAGDGSFLRVGTQLVSWGIHDGALPRPVPAPGEDLERWQILAGAPDTDEIAVVGSGRSGRWLRLVDGQGRTTPLLAGAELDGTPVAASYGPGPAEIQLVLAVPRGLRPESGSSWHVVCVDRSTLTARRTSFQGVLPAAVGDVRADIGPGGGWAVLWDSGGTAAYLVDLVEGTQTRLDRARPSAGATFRALPPGAAELRDDGTVALYDRAGRAVQELGAGQPVLRDAVVSPGGWAASVGDDGSVVRWVVDPATHSWSRPEVVSGHRGDVVDAGVPHGEQSLLVTTGRDGAVITWDMGSDGSFGGDYPVIEGRWVAGRPQRSPADGLVVVPTRPVSRAASADRSDPPPDTLEVAATFLHPDSGIVVDQVDVGRTLPGELSGASVAIDPGGRWIAVTWGNGVTVLDARDHAPIAELESVAPAVTSAAAWTPDGERLLLWTKRDLTTHSNGRLFVVDPDGWRVVRELDLPVPVEVVESDGQGRWLAAGAADGPELAVLDASDFTVVARVPLDDLERLLALAFSPDGRFLAAGGTSGLLQVIDTSTWTAAEPVALHDDPVLQVGWLADDRTVATTSLGGDVTLFDQRRGLVRARSLPGSTEDGQAHAYLVPGRPDELVVFSGERPGRRYPLDPAEWLRRVCSMAGRDLTPEEWSRYLPGRERRPTCSDLG